MRRANDQLLVDFHWAFVISVICVVLFGGAKDVLSPTHLLYAAALLGGSAVLARVPFSSEQLGSALMGFDTVFSVMGLLTHGAVSHDLLAGYFLAIVIASLADTQGRLAGAALFGTAAYALWMLRGGPELAYASSRLLRLPFVFVATIFYGTVIQRVRGERQYRRMLEESPHPMWIHDQDTHALLAVNDAATRDYGYSREELLAMTVDVLLAGDGAARRKDGSRVEVDIVSTPVLFAGRRGRLAIVSDVTARRRAEEETRRLAALLRSVIESTGEGLLVVSREGKITLSNQRFAQLWGVPREALETGDDERVLACVLDQLEDPEGFLARVRELGSNAAAESFDLIRFKDGRVLECRGGPVHCEDAGIGRVWSFRDVAARVQAEDEARRVSARYRELFAGVPLGLYRSTPDGSFEDVNPALAQMLGYPDGDALRRVRETDVYANVADRARLRARVEREGAVRGFEVDLRRRDGTILQGAVSARVVRDDQGRMVGYEGVVEDITERRKSEEMLLEALQKCEQSDWLKGNFLATMSHEIRTPLNIILGYSELIAGEDDGPSADLVQAIRRASHRLINTVQGMLDLAKLQSSSFECRPVELDLSKVVQERVQPFLAAARRKGLVLECVFEAPGAQVRFDEYCLGKALDSLLDNAVKFTPRGEVTVRVVRDASAGLRVEVRDTGIGISEEHLPRLFEPFAQEHLGDARPFEGAGVSLAVAKGLVELNGGHITVESDKGAGTTFAIHFEPPSAAPVLLTPSGNGANGNGKAARPTILIVEDDEDSQAYVETILGEAFRLLKASTAREARQLLAREHGEIRVVLMDLSLKGDEDGLALTRHVRSQAALRDLPVIATTAHALQEWRLSAAEAGCNAFLSKPFSPPQLLAAVGACLRGSEQAPAARQAAE
jgi:PAS domain S-box-containing protein